VCTWVCYLASGGGGLSGGPLRPAAQAAKYKGTAVRAGRGFALGSEALACERGGAFGDSVEKIRGLRSHARRE